MNMTPRPPLWNYQHEGSHFLATAPMSALLADEPGLGKTRQAINAFERMKHRRILVVCPAVARHVWEHEIERWSVSGTKSYIWTHATKPAELDAEKIVVIVSYNVLSTDKDKLRHLRTAKKWDVIIFDEAHYLKGPSNRSKAAFGPRYDGTNGLVARASYCWLLTGTPAPNHIGEMYNFCRTFLPEKFLSSTGHPMSRTQFEDAFCIVKTTAFGRQIIGSKNQAAFRQRIDGWMLRRRKKDVLTQIPPLRFEMTPLDLEDDTTRAIEREYEALRTEVPGLGTVVDGEIVDALRKANVALATRRRALGIIKTPAIAAFAEDMLAGSKNKLIIFAHHLEVIEKLMTRLATWNPVKIDGGTSPEDRMNAVVNFQKDPRYRVFIGQITAAGTAITLTAASTVLFAETSWVPNDNFQAACRAHRIGQNDGVVAHFLYAPGTLDTKILAAVKRKTEELAEVFD